MAVLRFARSACLALAVTLGCGDGLVERGFRGDPLFSFEGLVTFWGLFQGVDEFRASVFWSKTGEPTLELQELQEHTSASITVEFPAAFEMRLFQPPNLVDRVRPYTLGMILAYEDGNQSSTFDAGEFAGGASGAVLFYTERELSAEESPAGIPIPQGYSLATLPLPCHVGPPPFSQLPQQNSCGVPLGAACTQDQDCGAEGRCMTEARGGYCVMPQSVDCVPENGLLDSPLVETSTTGEFGELVWYRGCRNDQDCRVEDGHGCELGWWICFPKQPLQIEIGWGEGLGVSRLCDPIIPGD